MVEDKNVDEHLDENHAVYLYTACVIVLLSYCCAHPIIFYSRNSRGRLGFLCLFLYYYRVDIILYR